MTAERLAPRRLSRDHDGRAAAPVRMVHLGLGNFFRAHAAWYTEHASDGRDWGIAAFTGRSGITAPSLAEQDGLYTLLVRGSGLPHAEVLSSLSALHAADDLQALRRYFERPEVGVVTLTVTEAGYRRAGVAGLDRADPDVRADIAALSAEPLRGAVTTVPGKLVAGLISRRAAGGGPIAFVANDNVPDNGPMLARVVADLGAEVDPTLAEWVERNVSFVTTMVDRITPRTADEDRATALQLLGIDDPHVVPTEPFAEWVLSGDFPSGRPRWESCGARFVHDVRPFERRKLWLLNGAHSLMAYAGSLLGHTTVSQAIADPTVHAWVEEWWDAATPHLELPAREVAAYREALLERFTNPNIRHLLGQIAADGTQKIRIRALPVIEAGVATGRADPGATRLVAAWIVHLRGLGAPISDAGADAVVRLADGEILQAVTHILDWLGVTSAEVRTLVVRQVQELTEAEGA